MDDTLLLEIPMTALRNCYRYQKLQESHGYTSVLIGLEPTGHYWFSLADWLTARQIELVLVNSLTTKRNKENRDNSKSKNDVKDALLIDAVCRGFYSLYSPNEVIYQRLRTIMNESEVLVEGPCPHKKSNVSLDRYQFP